MTISTSLRVNAAEAVKAITMCFQTKLVAMLHGSPGIGKSAIFHQIAKAFKLKLIDIRLSQCDPCDLNGFPQTDGKKARYLPMDIFPLESDPIPDGYNGWLIVLDEINTAALAVQAASYKVTLDRKVGLHNLHPRALIGCAGNLATDGAIVNRMGTAMQSRLVHLELAVDHKIWSLWASANHLQHQVISYINFRPDHLHKFDPQHNDKTFPCPRTWEFASRIVAYPKLTLEEKLPTLAGTVGEGIAREFVMYCDVYQHIPTYQQIVKEADSLSITNEPSMLAAIAGTIGAHVNATDLPKVMKYVKRLPIEFQVFALRDAIKRNTEILKEKTMAEWVTINCEEMYSL